MRGFARLNTEYQACCLRIHFTYRLSMHFNATNKEPILSICYVYDYGSN